MQALSYVIELVLITKYEIRQDNNYVIDYKA